MAPVYHPDMNTGVSPKCTVPASKVVEVVQGPELALSNSLIQTQPLLSSPLSAPFADLSSLVTALSDAPPDAMSISDKDLTVEVDSDSSLNRINPESNASQPSPSMPMPNDLNSCKPAMRDTEAHDRNPSSFESAGNGNPATETSLPDFVSDAGHPPFPARRTKSDDGAALEASERTDTASLAVAAVARYSQDDANNKSSAKANPRKKPTTLGRSRTFSFLPSVREESEFSEATLTKSRTLLHSALNSSSGANFQVPEIASQELSESARKALELLHFVCSDDDDGDFGPVPQNAASMATATSSAGQVEVQGPAAHNTSSRDAREPHLFRRTVSFKDVPGPRSEQERRSAPKLPRLSDDDEEGRGPVPQNRSVPRSLSAPQRPPAVLRRPVTRPGLTPQTFFLPQNQSFVAQSDPGPKSDCVSENVVPVAKSRFPLPRSNSGLRRASTLRSEDLEAMVSDAPTTKKGTARSASFSGRSSASFSEKWQSMTTSKINRQLTWPERPSKRAVLKGAVKSGLKKLIRATSFSKAEVSAHSQGSS
eukprot:TRINITY_DN32389_c0_g1_i1.p1 TRINITY_DN32389_c0_g1~~TRINITY_DN32389_c0_g1_i1.p1  ORF type:complete len:539 (+),score=43.80 TRINITY_DN32389_c0_g1_i1:281-1897(+)